MSRYPNHTSITTLWISKLFPAMSHSHQIQIQRSWYFENEIIHFSYIQFSDHANKNFSCNFSAHATLSCLSNPPYLQNRAHNSRPSHMSLCICICISSPLKSRKFSLCSTVSCQTLGEQRKDAILYNAFSSENPICLVALRQYIYRNAQSMYAWAYVLNILLPTSACRCIFSSHRICNTTSRARMQHLPVA